MLAYSNYKLMVVEFCIFKISLQAYEAKTIANLYQETLDKDIFTKSVINV